MLGGFDDVVVDSTPEVTLEVVVSSLGVDFVVTFSVLAVVVVISSQIFVSGQV